MALKDAARLDRPCDLALDALRPKPNGLSTPFLLSDWKRENKYRRSPPTRSLDQTFPSLLTHMSPPSNGHRTAIERYCLPALTFACERNGPCDSAMLPAFSTLILKSHMPTQAVREMSSIQKSS